MKRLQILSPALVFLTFFSLCSYGQWSLVMEDVLPVDIAISPEYFYDQTVYVVDDDERLFISETGGSVWVQLYEANDPSNPTDLIHDVVISPNFLNDNALVMIHKDGSARLSFNRGQQWIILPAPEGTSGIVFSQKFADDAKMYGVTGALGPVAFYRSYNGGASWDKISELVIGGGFYCKLWNSSDSSTTDIFGVQYDNNAFYMSFDGGETWTNSFAAEVSMRDCVFSPQFGEDSTIFIADAAKIWKNTSGGNALSWTSIASFSETFGIRFAISPTFSEDQTLYAAVDRVGILVTTDGGATFTDFNDGFLSTLPISIAISQEHPYTLFAGTQGSGGAPGGVWKYQTTSGVGDDRGPGAVILSANPNPFTDETEISFELTKSGFVSLGLYDSSGRKRATLHEGEMARGFHRVSCNEETVGLPPGMYLLRITSTAGSGSLKVIRY
jgi:photosystem II stability/assembly factor-like uncharacterized protein